MKLHKQSSGVGKYLKLRNEIATGGNLSNMHDDEQASHKDAERLCKKHGVKFYSCECTPTWVCEPAEPPVNWKKI